MSCPNMKIFNGFYAFATRVIFVSTKILKESKKIYITILPLKNSKGKIYNFRALSLSNI